MQPHFKIIHSQKLVTHTESHQQDMNCIFITKTLLNIAENIEGYKQ